MKESTSQYASLPLSAIFEEFASGDRGLSSKQAISHLEKYGINSFEIAKKRPLFMQWGLAFLSPLPIILIALSIVSYWIGESRGAIVIGLMVLLSVTFAFFKSIDRLKPLKNSKPWSVLKLP